LSELGNFCWNELMTRDVEKAKKFYGGVIGWSFDDMPIRGGWVAKVGDKLVGGLFTLMSPQFGGVTEAWVAYLAVDDVDARVKKATAAGARLMRPTSPASAASPFSRNRAAPASAGSRQSCADQRVGTGLSPR
jgi:predicted enzyme related to lactoylglutathione lyase